MPFPFLRCRCLKQCQCLYCLSMCNKLSKTQCLKTTNIYYLIVSMVRNLGAAQSDGPGLEPLMRWQSRRGPRVLSSEALTGQEGPPPRWCIYLAVGMRPQFPAAQISPWGYLSVLTTWHQLSPECEISEAGWQQHFLFFFKQNTYLIHIYCGN